MQILSATHERAGIELQGHEEEADRDMGRGFHGGLRHHDIPTSSDILDEHMGMGSNNVREDSPQHEVALMRIFSDPP